MTRYRPRTDLVVVEQRRHVHHHHHHHKPKQPSLGEVAQLLYAYGRMVEITGLTHFTIRHTHTTYTYRPRRRS